MYLTVEFLGGTSIDEACREMLKLKHELHGICEIQTHFNGVLITTIFNNVDKMIDRFNTDMTALKEIKHEKNN